MPPGHFLLATGGQFRLIRYWDFDYPAVDDDRPGRPDAEYAERFHHELDEAVRLRLRADVPVGCYLSGGIDSCAVLGLAAKHRVDPIRAFTLTFDRASYDEGDIAREMAAHSAPIFSRSRSGNPTSPTTLLMQHGKLRRFASTHTAWRNTC